VSGNLCGQGQTQQQDDQIVYVIDVLADGTGSVAGCGAPGRLVRFEVGSQVMSSIAVWDNNRPRRLPLSIAPLQYVYLPLIVKGQ
jgi:hypothetical protein